jgi:uncharacterized protein YdhG (YjbR/CyaY superfamily)
MAKTTVTSVAQYLAAQPPAARRVLARVRSVIRKAVPSADEVIAYGIPTYKLHGRPVIYFAGWTHHFAIYPSNSRIVAAFKDELAAYEMSKGTIRFPLSEPVPARLIAGIAALRAKEVAADGMTRRAAVKKR